MLDAAGYFCPDAGNARKSCDRLFISHVNRVLPWDIGSAWINMNLSKYKRLFLLFSAVSGFLSVAFGAFAAHGLQTIITEQLLQTFQTGVHYQVIHTLALLSVVLLPGSGRVLMFAGWSFIFGIIFFSGSLYLLTLTDMRLLGAITPFGGTLFLVGWACLGVYAWKLNRE